MKDTLQLVTLCVLCTGLQSLHAVEAPFEPVPEGRLPNNTILTQKVVAPLGQLGAGVKAKKLYELKESLADPYWWIFNQARITSLTLGALSKQSELLFDEVKQLITRDELDSRDAVHYGVLYRTTKNKERMLEHYSRRLIKEKVDQVLAIQRDSLEIVDESTVLDISSSVAAEVFLTELESMIRKNLPHSLPDLLGVQDLSQVRFKYFNNFLGFEENLIERGFPDKQARLIMEKIEERLNNTLDL